MTVRDDLIPVVDDARGIVASLGLRRDVVTVVSVTRVGVGLSAVDTESVLTLTPPPRVNPVPSRLFTPGGVYQTGDVFVDKISARYTRAQLEPAGLRHWTIDGAKYRAISVADRNFEWRVSLRPLQRPT